MIKKILIVLIILITLLLGAAAGEELQTIIFGSYWQDATEEKTPIEWYVLKETDGALLLLSRYSLDANIFNRTEATTWENSAMRQFLNTYFYANAFSATERKNILLTEITTSKNPIYPSTPQGAPTKDYIFLLSVEEVERYLPFSYRIAAATSFARIGHARIIGTNWRGAYVSPFGATCWRLRTMGKDALHGTYIEANGAISYGGDILNAPHYAVRPCIWIKKS